MKFKGRQNLIMFTTAGAIRVRFSSPSPQFHFNVERYFSINNNAHVFISFHLISLHLPRNGKHLIRHYEQLSVVEQKLVRRRKTH